MGLRVSAEEEIEGLDIGEHGNTAYPDFAQAIPGGFHAVSSGGGSGNLAAAYATQPMSAHGAR